MSSAVPSYNFTWEQGEDGIVALIYKVGTPAATVDLSTGYAVRMDVRSGSTLLFTFNSADITANPPVDSPGSADNEGILGEDGQIFILVPRAASLTGGAFADLIGQSLAFDVFLRNTVANTQKKILKGTIKIEESFTLWN